MSTFLKGLSIVLLIFGVIGSCVIAEDFGFLGFFMGFLSVGLFCTGLFWMGSVLERLDYIAENIKMVSQNVNKPAPLLYTAENSWICKNCKAKNFKYETICKCGQRRDEEDELPPL